jgi:hypothetical protein
MSVEGCCINMEKAFGFEVYGGKEGRSFVWSLERKAFLVLGL